MFNFTRSPGGQRFGRIWVSGGSKKPPILPYTDINGFVVDDSLMYERWQEPGSAASNLKQYQHANLIEETEKYKLYGIDEYVMWDTVINDITQIDPAYRTGFLKHYDYGYISPNKNITYFGNRTGIGLQYYVGDRIFYAEGGATARTPFCYRLVGRYIRHAEKAERTTPSVSDIQNKISALQNTLGTYSDSGITYAGSPQEILQTGTLYNAPEIPRLVSDYGNPIEYTLDMSSTINDMKYLYRKGPTIKSNSGMLDFQIVNPQEITYSVIGSEAQGRAISAYLNPYKLLIYPIVPYIKLKENPNDSTKYVFDKMQKAKFYQDMKSGAQAYNFYYARVYGAPDPYVLETNNITLESETFNHSNISLNTSQLGMNKTDLPQARIPYRLGIKYNIRKEVYKIPVKTFMYKQGASSLLTTAYGFDGYLSLFEVDPSLLPT
jgi:hypothetical protein